MLWCDKYRPLTLDQLTYDTEATNMLKRMGSSKSFPHLLFSGQSGSGKKTRISAFLRELFGPQAQKLKLEEKDFVVFSLPCYFYLKPKEGAKKISLPIITSSYHIEVNPSEAGYYDRVIVQEMIKDVAQSRPLDSRVPFKVIVIHEADELSKDAQNALRRTMEKTSASCRIILCCTSASKIILPIRSRCFNIRVASPSDEVINDSINYVSKKEGLSIPEEFGKRIIEQADGNLRKALLILESEHVRKYPFSNDQVPLKTDWEQVISNIVNEILTKQASDQQKLLSCRMMVYELLAHCIPPNVILLKLLEELRAKTDHSLVLDMYEWAALYDHRVVIGSKAIFHIEAFIARFMALYKKFLLDVFDE